MTTPPPSSRLPEPRLEGWLDAASLGGFPLPVRSDRWQVLRAGVVNLWEFDLAEYWYANGWTQLIGRNETGKSSLMALTTLIPWLADTSSSNIDTLGRSGKKFRYYVEPTGADGDRRETNSTANRGWLWVEYGRLTDAGPRYFTTMMFAEARSAAADIKPRWCSVEGTARVREAFELAPQRMVAAPKELTVPGLIVHDTAGLYRNHVAARLLGSTDDRLESIGKMLKVTRTPKLGAQLEVGFVQRHLRTALPELSRAEVDALADGWDQLDQIRDDLAAAKEAADTLEKFRRSAWLPWARAVVRQRADAASVARTAFDAVTRRETEARATVESKAGIQQQRAEQVAAARQVVDSRRRAADELQASARFQDAQGRISRLENYRTRLTEADGRSSRAEQDLAGAQLQEDQAVAEASRYEHAHSQRVNEAAQATADLRDAVAPLIELPPGELDLPWVEQLLGERERTIDVAQAQSVRVAAAENAATTQEEVAGVAREQAERDATAAQEAWATAEATRNAVSRAVTVWASGLTPEVTGPQVDAWLECLPADEAEARRSRLGVAIRADWFDPARSHYLQIKERALVEQERASAELARLDAEIDRLLATPTPVFPGPTGWRRRVRPEPTPTGAPLWALVDPRDTVPEAELAHLEAGLAASGLLDAWVSADGVVAAAGGDTFIVVPPPVTGSTLGDYLTIAPCDPAVATVVAGLLAGVAVAGSLQESGSAPLVVGLDGSWRSLGLVGRAEPQQATAEWVGESARAHRRRRQVEELTAQREEGQAQLRTAASSVRQAEAALDTVAEQYQRCPDDGELRSILGRAAHLDETAERSAASAATAVAKAERLRAAADTRRAELLRFCSEHRLPSDAETLGRHRRDAGTAREKIRLVGLRVEQRDGAAEELSRARARLDSATERKAELKHRHDTIVGEVAELTATVHTLQATIGADDREILDELQRLGGQEQQAADERDRLEAELRVLAGELGQAQEQLHTAEEERERAREVRDQAWTDFRVLVERGLALEIGLASDAGFLAAERVRDQVAIARREISPPRWPSDTAEQDSHVRRLHTDLIKAAEDVRVKLEAGGRTLTVEPDAFGLPIVGVLVDSTGSPLGPLAATARLAEVHDELSNAYNHRVQQTLDELLGSTFLEHLRDRLGATTVLINRINDVLAAHPVVTTKTSLKIQLEPASPSDKAMLDAVSGPLLTNPEVAAQVRDRLRERVEEAKRLAETQGDENWRGRLAQQLDYREWFDVQLKKRVGAGGRWVPLTTQGYAEMSGGARAVILMLPLVATLAALYEDLDGCPRPLWLDEAFDGLDAGNRAMMMDLFGSFDLDVLVVGPARLVNVRTVPAAAIYQVVRAPAPLPGVDLTLELWAGGELTEVVLPTVLPTGSAQRIAVSAVSPPDPTDEGRLL